MAQLYSRVPVNHNSVTLNQQAQDQDPESGAAKLSSTISIKTQLIQEQYAAQQSIHLN